MKQIFQLRLVLKHPNDSKTSDNGLIDRKQELNEAVEEFNLKFGYKKIVEILEISQKSILMIFEIEQEVSIRNPGKELSALSKILYHKKGWGVFSAVEGRLFTVADCAEITEYKKNNFHLGDEDILKSARKISDQEMIKYLNFILEVQEKGKPDTIEKRKEAIMKIKYIIADCLDM